MTWKQTLGLFLMVLSLLWLLVLGVYQGNYRYSHETLTETQLSIWMLLHWKYWAPPAVLGVVGLVLMNIWDEEK